jgi:tripartite-type tricarboxylate transporter receptor subunit TctC
VKQIITAARVVNALAFGLLALACSSIGAQDFPSRQIRFVVPAPAGGAPDAIARLVGKRLGDRLGKQVVVDNRGGGNGVIGSELVARAPADGYTIVLGYAGPFGINPGFYPSLPYDPVRDFAPLTMLATSQNILVVHPSFAARSLKGMIAMANERPGQINYASGGTGQSSHLSMELLMHMANIKMTHIPYKGAGPALADTLGGQVPLHFLALAPAIPLIKANKLLPLAVTGAKRAPSLPDVPTIAEAGLPGYEVLTWYAAFAPAATPKPVLARLHDEMSAVLKTAELAGVFQGHGLEPGGGSADSLGRFLDQEIAKWRNLIKASGIKAE